MRVDNLAEIRKTNGYWKVFNKEGLQVIKTRLSKRDAQEYVNTLNLSPPKPAE